MNFKAWILLNQTRTEKQMHGNFETYNLFIFFSLILSNVLFRMFS